MAFAAGNREDGETSQVGSKACEHRTDDHLLFVACSILCTSADVNMCFASCLHTQDPALVFPVGWLTCCCALAVDSCLPSGSIIVSMVLPRGSRCVWFCYRSDGSRLEALDRSVRRVHARQCDTSACAMAMLCDVGSVQAAFARQDEGGRQERRGCHGSLAAGRLRHPPERNVVVTWDLDEPIPR